MAFNVRTIAFVALIVAVAVFVSSFAFEFAAGYAWPEQKLPRPSTGDGDYKLEWDSEGDLHMAYLGVYGAYYALYHGEMVDGQWSLTYLSRLYSEHQGASLALDSHDNAYVCTSCWEGVMYTDLNRPHIVFATNAGGQWAAEVINTTGVCLSAEVAVDGEDKVHIFYSTFAIEDDDASPVIIDMLLTDSGWESTVVNHGGDEVDTLWIDDLETRPDGRIGLVYTCVSGGQWIGDGDAYAWLNYGIVSDGEIAESTVMESFMGDGEVSLCHGSSGETYMCTYARAGEEGFRLCYFTDAEGGWICVDVAYAGTSWPSGTSVSVDSEGRLHFGYFATYYDGTTYNHTVRYCTEVDGEWETRVLDDSYGWHDESIAVIPDAEGDIHIVYYQRVTSEDSGDRYATIYVTSELDPDRHYSEIVVSALRAALTCAIVAVSLLLILQVRRKMREMAERAKSAQLDTEHLFEPPRRRV